MEEKPMDLQPRQHLLFDKDWRFTRKDVAHAENVAFKDTGWRALDLPHDWSIEGPFDPDAPAGGGGGYLPGGIGWYRKRFRLSDEDRKKQFTLQFDGVYKNCDVWLNGEHLGFHPYGYTSFHYEITPVLNFDGEENIIAVRVDNSQQPDARWYNGSGIFRHVWLTITDALHVAHYGTFVRTPLVSDALARVEVLTRVRNDSYTPKNCVLITKVVDAAGEVVGTAESLHPIASGQEYEFVDRIRVVQPRLWSVEDPYLYRVQSIVKEGDRVVDDYETPLDIREIAFDADQGFLLNGQQVKINGACLHHDGGCVGAAVPERVWERRLETLKTMGCNGIRTSHYPPAPEFLDLCDRMGFLVMDENFDEW
ncbi:MAG: glycoside hydrolase family 2, partial [Anaerolineales bacterium]